LYYWAKKTDDHDDDDDDEIAMTFPLFFVQFDHFFLISWHFDPIVIILMLLNAVIEL